MTISICVVGCGEQAQKLLDEALHTTGDVNLYFTSEYVEDAQSYNQKYMGSGVFHSFEDAVNDKGVDAFYFATPHNLHHEHVVRAAKLGKHILVEKPIALTVTSAQTMISCANESGVVLMVSEPVRYLPTVQKCKEIVSEGVIGDLRLIHVQNQLYDRPDGWRTDAKLRGGGELIDGGMHSIDILINLGGYPSKLYAALPKKLFREVDGDDGAVVTAHLPGGVLGLLNLSSSTSTNMPDFRVMVTGEKGQIRFEPDASEITVDTRESVTTVSVECESGVSRMMKEFFSNVSNKCQPLMTGEEGAKDLAVALAAYKSADLGTEIEVQAPFPIN